MSELSAIVCGVDTARVNLTTLNAALKDAGIKVTSKTTLPQRVELLAKFELDACKDDATLPEEQRKGGDCSVCGGVSQLSRPACPFCGTSEEQPSPNAPVAAPPPKSRKEAAARAKPPAKAKGKPPVDKKALAKAEAGKVLKANVDQLDQAERRIQGLLKDGMSAQWKLGREINTVFTNGLFKFRVDANGKPRHNFGAWCEANNLSVQYARSLMHVAANYTEAQVRDVGVTKLGIVLRAPKELRGELLEKAAGGASRNEIEEEVRRVAPGATRETIGSGSDAARPGLAGTGGRRARAAAGATSARVVGANEVTAVFALTRYEVPMFARAKSAETGDPIRATTVASDPHAVLALQNGVQLHIRWVESPEGLISVIEFKREEEATK